MLPFLDEVRPLRVCEKIMRIWPINRFIILASATSHHTMNDKNVGHYFLGELCIRNSSRRNKCGKYRSARMLAVSCTRKVRCAARPCLRRAEFGYYDGIPSFGAEGSIISTVSNSVDSFPFLQMLLQNQPSSRPLRATFSETGYKKT